jgi:hypothetical protein
VATGRQIGLGEEERRALSAEASGANRLTIRLCRGPGELVAIGEFLEPEGIVKPKAVFISPGN